MKAEVTKRAKIALPPRAINVHKYAEIRQPELQSLQSIVENRVNNDYKSQRNKRRRTTAFRNQTTRKKKRQDPGIVSENNEETKKIPRRIRRRHELKMNPVNGFCVCGDGTKRLRTHVWHAKRFTMIKLWGYNLPLGLHGRGKGSRALLKRLKHGVLVHDESYCTAIQLEGPEDSLLSVLRMVLEPSPVTHPENHDDTVVSGINYGSAMLYRIGALVSQAIAPVTYMWQPISQQNMTMELDSCDESMKDLGEKPDLIQHGDSFRRLLVWIHASAFVEGYDNLKLACQQEMEKSGISINCVSLEGQLAKIELMGSGTFQLLQKILHPVRGISKNHFQLRKHVATEEDVVSQNKRPLTLKNEDNLSSHAMLSLNVMDPRDLPRKRAVDPTDTISTEELSDAQEINYEKLDVMEGGMLEKNTDLSSSSCSKLEERRSGVDDLWRATSRGWNPPMDDSVLSKEKRRKHLVNFCLDDIDPGDEKSSTKVQCSSSCPILLLKNDTRELVVGWSVILPLSWVKAFWIPLISNGAHAIGLREKHWISCEMGLSLFPSDFPDCKAYSCFMEAKAADFNKEAELRPPSKRQLTVPILPPWDIVRNTFKKEISVVKSDVSNKEDFTNANSLPNTSLRTFETPKSDSENNSFDGTVARSGCMLTTFLDEAKAGQLLLFPYADRKARISKFLSGELKLDQSHRSSVVYDHKLCFLRVHLHPFKEGFFEEGAVICAPFPSDISLWTSGEEKSQEGLQTTQSAVGLYFKEHSSGKWGMQIPDDSIAKESHRWPIGFVTTACVQGSKKLAAVGFCEAVLLADLREEQWKEMPVKQRRREIYVLVRNLRSVAYRLALASIVLENQENDVDFL
ncbi:putative ribonuclease P [Lupinus albus]|uniref:Putative ribonuclease P n=1 Tax=Lupinus albus TaxID=3870 RepID=A0A6A4QYY9_LUPAL|nr:putative ribonuclease P [Lupinus albus]